LVLKDVYPADRLSSLWLARWDHHPNAAGHRMIADRLYEALRRTNLVAAPQASR
jgi:hypothetical protein